MRLYFQPAPATPTETAPATATPPPPPPEVAVATQRLRDAHFPAATTQEALWALTQQNGVPCRQLVTVGHLLAGLDALLPELTGDSFDATPVLAQFGAARLVAGNGVHAWQSFVLCCRVDDQAVVDVAQVVAR